MDQKGKADLITLACGDAPEWHDHWTLSASAGLADQMVELGLVESHSYETVRLNLRKTSSNRGAISPPEADASPTWAASSWRPPYPVSGRLWRMCWTCTQSPMALTVRGVL